MKNIFSKTNFSSFVLSLSVILLSCILFLSSTGAVFCAYDTKAIYRGNENNQNVSLMFNVYQGDEYIENILYTLQKYSAVATFFVGGCYAVNHIETLQKIIDGGHEIGNHGYWHKDHKKLNYQNNHKEMILTHKIVKEHFNYEIKLFAPPSGSYSTTTLKAAQDLNYQTIMWSNDTIDWRDQNVDLIFSRATKNAKNGNLVLMHPTKCTMLALDKICGFYNTNNFNMVSVSKNIA